MLFNYHKKECVVCNQTIDKQEPEHAGEMLSGIVFTHLQGKPFICEKCVFVTIVKTLCRNQPTTKFEEYLK